MYCWIIVLFICGYVGRNVLKFFIFFKVFLFVLGIINIVSIGSYSLNDFLINCSIIRSIEKIGIVG